METVYQKEMRKLKRAYKKSGLSPDQWAIRANVNRGTVFHFLGGYHDPTLTTMIRLAKPLGVVIDVETLTA